MLQQVHVRTGSPQRDALWPKGLKTSPTPMNAQVAEQNVVDPFNGLGPSHEMERSTDTRETWMNLENVTLSETGQTKGHALHDSLDMTCPDSHTHRKWICGLLRLGMGFPLGDGCVPGPVRGGDCTTL